MLEIYILNIILKFHYVQIMYMINKQEVDFQNGGGGGGGKKKK
jgi:hypothetical protein